MDESSVRAAIGEPEALEAAERAFVALAKGRVTQPPPLALAVPDAEGEVHVKTAYIAGAAIVAIKVATGFYGNVSRNLPTGAGLMVLLDAGTGFPLALLADNGYLTEMRTAAAGALAARHLAPTEFDRLAVLGTGVQARFQVRALARIRRWSETLAWSPDPDRCRAYCREMSTVLDRPFRPAADADSAVRGTDVVVTVTPSRRPLFAVDSLAAHATVIAVGSDSPEKQELPVEALERADKVVVDRLSQCMELGEVHHAIAAGVLEPGAIHAELGEVLAGQKAGREGEELIVCDLTGVGVQDAAIAEAAWSVLAGR